MAKGKWVRIGVGRLKPISFLAVRLLAPGSAAFVLRSEMPVRRAASS